MLFLLMGFNTIKYFLFSLHTMCIISIELERNKVVILNAWPLAYTANVESGNKKSAILRRPNIKI